VSVNSITGYDVQREPRHASTKLLSNKAVSKLCWVRVVEKVT